MKTIDLASRSYAAGTRTVGPRDIPQGYTTLTATLTRESWPDTGSDVVTVRVDISYDGGATWILNHVGFTASGGNLTNRQGQATTESRVIVPIPEPTSTTRQLRITVTNAVTLTTGITVDIV